MVSRNTECDLDEAWFIFVEATACASDIQDTGTALGGQAFEMRVWSKGER
jgi:hypothetical protein